MAHRRVDELATGNWLRLPNDDRIVSDLRGLVARVIPGPSHNHYWRRRPDEVWLEVYEHGRLNEYWMSAKTVPGTVETLAPEEGESEWLIAQLVH